MTEYGYFLSCEQFTPDELIAQARRAQQAGFTRLAISDHFHPWNDAQGNSAFVWSTIGALNVHAYADTGHCAKGMPKCAGPDRRRRLPGLRDRAPLFPHSRGVPRCRRFGTDPSGPGNAKDVSPG